MICRHWTSIVQGYALQIHSCLPSVDMIQFIAAGYKQLLLKYGVFV
jgi:hypothetical protein